MEATKRMIRYQFQELKKFLLVFWVVLLLVMIGSYGVNLFVGASQKGVYLAMGDLGAISVAGILFLPLMIVTIIYAMLMYYEDFPISIGFSVTRSDFYKAVVVSGVVRCFVLAVISGMLLKLDRHIILAIGREPLVDFKLFHTLEDTIFFLVLSLFITLLAFTSIFNLMGALLYRFGAIKFWVSVLLLVNLLGVPSVKKMQLKMEWFPWELLRTRHFTYLLLITGISYGIGYLVIRRMNVKPSQN